MTVNFYITTSKDLQVTLILFNSIQIPNLLLAYSIEYEYVFLYKKFKVPKKIIMLLIYYQILPNTIHTY